MKVYVSGKITGLDQKEYLEKFEAAQKYLELHGHKVMNPASAMFTCTAGFGAEEYLHVCYAMIDVCDVIYICLTTGSQVREQGKSSSTPQTGGSG